MTLNRLVYKSHKWLAVGVGLLTLMWFGTGVVMMLPKRVLGGSRAGTAGNAANLDFKGITISVPQAIAAAEAAAGGSIVTTNVDLREIEGRLYYLISTAKSGRHLIDAVSGTRLEITEEYAKQMAARLLGGGAQPQETQLWKQYTAEYTFGPLPVYRVAFGDSVATIVYVSKNSGEVTSSERKGRIRGYLTGMHTFEFLRGWLLTPSIRALLLIFSFVGLCMSILGGWILLIQFQNWRARRAGRAVEA